jgi:hypothetical protein
MEKMKNRILLILVAVILIALLIGFIYSDNHLSNTIPAVDNTSLIERAKEIDGTEVIYQGEVIGDIMPRDDHYWINVLYNGTAFGIWITDEQRSKISLTGRFGIRGDEVKIVGQFNQACSEHGGDLDIHAKSVEIVNEGNVIPQEINWARMIIAACLFIAAVCLLIALKWKSNHRYPSIIK